MRAVTRAQCLTAMAALIALSFEDAAVANAAQCMALTWAVVGMSRDFSRGLDCIVVAHGWRASEQCHQMRPFTPMWPDARAVLSIGNQMSELMRNSVCYKTGAMLLQQRVVQTDGPLLRQGQACATPPQIKSQSWQCIAAPEFTVKRVEILAKAFLSNAFWQHVLSLKRQ